MVSRIMPKLGMRAIKAELTQVQLVVQVDAWVSIGAVVVVLMIQGRPVVRLLVLQVESVVDSVVALMVVRMVGRQG